MLRYCDISIFDVAIYFIFISAMPMAIQMISLTRQMMLTKMPRAADSPNAAMDSTKPPS